MVDRVFVHVGPPKTGTSSIQNGFAANAELLARESVLYPTWPADEFVRNKHDFIECLSVSDPIESRWIAAQGIADPGLAAERLNGLHSELYDKIAVSDPSTVVLSSEAIGNGGFAEPGNIERLAVLLSKISTDVTIVFYARHHVAHSRSLVQHLVRSGVRTLDDCQADPPVQTITPRIEAFEEVFDQVVVRANNRDFDPGFDVVDDFARVLNLDVQFEKPASSTNPAVSHEAVLLWDALGRAYPQRKAISGVRNPKFDAWAVPRTFPGRKFSLAAETEERIRQDAAGDIGVLAERYGIEWPELPPIEQAELWGPSTIAAIAEELAIGAHVKRLLAKLQDGDSDGD